MDHQARRRFQMRNKLTRHEAGEGQIDQRKGVDDRKNKPAAIARGDKRHHRTDDEADQRTDIQQAKVLADLNIENALIERHRMTN